MSAQLFLADRQSAQEFAQECHTFADYLCYSIGDAHTQSSRSALWSL